MNFFRRHWRKLVFIPLFTPIVLVLVLILLLYLPPVQQWASQYAARKASEAMDMQIQVGRLRVGFPLSVYLADVYAIKSPKDTLASIGELRVDVSLMPLLSNKIEIAGLGVEKAYINYVDSTGLTCLRAHIGDLQTSAMEVDLKGEQASLGRWLLRDADIYYASTDTTSKPKQKKEPLRWLINLRGADLANVKANIRMPLDSLFVSAHIKDGSLSGLKANLGLNRYTAERIHLAQSAASYARDTVVSHARSVLDPFHIKTEEIHIEARNLVSQSDVLSVDLLGGSFREQSGVQLLGLKGKYRMDSTYMDIQGLDLRINGSILRGDLYLQTKLFEKDPDAKARVALYASFLPEDIKRLSGFDLSPVRPSYATQSRKRSSPIEVNVEAQGSMTLVSVQEAALHWSPYVHLTASGRIAYPMDGKRRRGDFAIDGQTERQVHDLLSLFAPEVSSKYTVPSGLSLRGKIDIDRDNYRGDLLLKDAGSVVSLNGLVNLSSEAYRVGLKMDGVDVHRYMPTDSIGLIYASLSASGRGFDYLDRRTYSNLDLRVGKAQYGSYQIDSLSLEAALKEGVLSARLDSKAEAARLQAQIDAIVSKDAISAAIVVDADTIDAYRLGFSSSPLATSFHLNGSAQTNLKGAHIVDFNLTELLVTAGDQRIAPREIQLSAQSGADSLTLRVEAGDLRLNLFVHEYLDSLSGKLSSLTTIVSKELDRVAQMEQTRTDLREVYAAMPKAQLQLHMGIQNPLADYLSHHRMYVRSVDIDLSTSPTIGLDGLIDLQDLRSDTTRIDRVTLALGDGVNTSYFPHGQGPEVYRMDSIIRSDSVAVPSEYINMMLRVRKSPFRNQKAFDVEIAGRVSLRAAALRGVYLNEKREKAVELGLRAYRDGMGYGLHFEPSPYPFVLAQQKIRINPDNEIYYHKDEKRIRANLQLTTPDSAQLSIHTPSRQDGLEEIIILVKRLELGHFQAIPAMADFSGALFADLRVQRSGGANGQYMGSGDLSVNDLTYATNRVGNISASFFYEPRNKVSHYITGDISYNGNSALSLDGIYNTDSRLEPINADVRLTDFPLAIVNPIVGSDVATLFGHAIGHLSIVGTTSSPAIDGSIRLHNAGAKVTQFGTTIYTDSIPLRFDHSAIFFDRYALFADAARTNPLIIDGSFTLFGRRSMYTDLTLSASDLILVNSREPDDGQLLYGRLAVGAKLSLQGPASAIRVRGNIDILGNTNCTYIYTDSPLKPQNRMAGVVEFTDFSDTLFVAHRKDIQAVDFGGMDLLVGIHIAPAAQLGVDLSPGHSDYVQIRGGGDLTFSYPPFGNMSLTGRYEMTGGGDVRYNLPVVGSKMFKIDPDSYISWSGDVADPYIHFRASQRVRADVADGGDQASRKVNFDVSIVARENLSALSLAFDLATPEDLSLETQIKAMSPEERGKQAIGLMATGMYLASNGTGGFNFDDALSALIQSELNNVTGKLLEGSDLSIGMQDSDHSTGGSNPDITYSFSRRFFNDRIRVVVGGKVQTGNAPAATRERTFIDNVSLEYRIDQAGSHYLKLFHQNKTDNILEGEVIETGVGYLIRRKLNRVNELFDFRRHRNKLIDPQPSSQRDTIAPRKESSDTIPLAN